MTKSHVDQARRIFHARPVLVIKQRHAPVGPKHLVYGIAIQETPVENRNARVLGAGNHTVNVGHTDQLSQALRPRLN